MELIQDTVELAARNLALGGRGLTLSFPQSLVLHRPVATILVLNRVYWRISPVQFWRHGRAVARLHGSLLRELFCRHCRPECGNEFLLQFLPRVRHSGKPISTRFLWIEPVLWHHGNAEPRLRRPHEYRADRPSPASL
jgi:hypothetical protein